MLRRLERLGHHRQVVGLASEVLDHELTDRRRPRRHEPVDLLHELLEVARERRRLEPVLPHGR
jgi:hypothetical protein